MKLSKLYCLLLLSLLALASCEDEFDPGGTEAEALAGEWYVRTTLDGQVLLDYVLIATYNTAANTPDALWVDDYENIWPFKVEADGNTTELSFGGNSLRNTYADTTFVSILEGRIIENAATSSGGNRADSIRLRVEFSDDPGNVYEIAGYRRTGFLEDEH